MGYVGFYGVRLEISQLKEVESDWKIAQTDQHPYILPSISLKVSMPILLAN